MGDGEATAWAVGVGGSEVGKLGPVGCKCEWDRVVTMVQDSSLAQADS